jgi:hypothetical protein
LTVRNPTKTPPDKPIVRQAAILEVAFAFAFVPLASLPAPTTAIPPQATDNGGRSLTNTRIFYR